MSDDLPKRLDKMRSKFHFFKHHSDLKDPDQVSAIEEADQVLSDALIAVSASSDTTRKLADAMENLAMERSSNRKARAALQIWDELFTSDIEVIRGNAGLKVAAAVTLTRQALGK